MRRARLIPFLFSCVALILPRVSNAQWQWTTDLGLSHLRQQGIEESNALTLGTAVDAYSDRAWLRVSGLASRATFDRWTGQGVVVGSLLGPATHVARWELSGSATGFTETGFGPTTSFEIMAGARFGSPLAGASLDAGGGMTRSPVAMARGVLQMQAGAWRAAAVNAFALNAALTRFHTPAAGTLGPSPIEKNADYADASIAWRRDHNGWSASLNAGARIGSSLVESGTWASGEGAVWLSNHVAFVASGGRALADPIRGVPSTRFVSASIRIAAEPHDRLGGATRPQVVAGRERMDIDLPKAASVELMADFTDWAPVPLVRTGGVWRLEHSISPGLHRVAIRVDGGDWIAPPGVPHATDDLGGVVGLITVP